MDALPLHLAERLEPMAPAPRADGEYVVCWLRAAARAHDNPALDVALAMGRALKRPVFVLQVLADGDRFASDRHHTFALEGARELAAALAERGVGHALHLEPRGEDGAHLLAVAREAALVVADALPLSPFRARDGEVAKAAPLWRVDAACVVPLWLSDVPFARAADFRKEVSPQWQRRLEAPWEEVAPEGDAFLPELPFTPVDLGEDLADLVARCDVDHSVAPVQHTPGGAAAAWACWVAFRDGPLDTWGTDTGETHAGALATARGKLTAYLNAGHLAAFTIAREAAARRTGGAQAFLEDLLLWRELSWNFCRHHADVESVAALPEWAQRSFKAHEGDRREAHFSFEQLARAQTGHRVWDACQRSLLTQGTLHPALRRPWAQALLHWTRDAAEALTLAITLTGTWALHARAPTSSVGLLTHFGLFGEPDETQRPVSGALKLRTLEDAAGQVDVAEFERTVRRPTSGHALTVAVVGAGVAGAACARTLKDAGHAVTLFEKSPTPGGRMATRQEGGARFDCGAPSFAVKDERFARWARAWWQERLLAEWKPRGGSGGLKVVAVPGMQALVERLHVGLDVRFDAAVAGLARDEGRWRLKDEHGASLGEYEAVVLAAPAPVAAQLVDPHSFALASRLREVQMTPCWALLLDFEAPLETDVDVATPTVGPLAWLARESSKPERSAGARWAAHATGAWSAAHLDESPFDVVEALLEAFFVCLGATPAEPRYAKALKWHTARTEKPLGESCLFDAGLKLAACGDWCLGDTVEAAFLSGCAAGGRLNALRREQVVPEPRPSSPTRRDQLPLL